MSDVSARRESTEPKEGDIVVIRDAIKYAPEITHDLAEDQLNALVAENRKLWDMLDREIDRRVAAEANAEGWHIVLREVSATDPEWGKDLGRTETYLAVPALAAASIRRTADRCTALEAELAAIERQREELWQEQDDKINRTLHYILHGECPAYPGSGAACNTMICDCSSKWEDVTTEELVAELRARLSGSPAATEKDDTISEPQES